MKVKASFSSSTWEDQSKYEKYLAWRTESGVMDKLALCWTRRPLFASGPTPVCNGAIRLTYGSAFYLLMNRPSASATD